MGARLAGGSTDRPRTCDFSVDDSDVRHTRAASTTTEQPISSTRIQVNPTSDPEPAAWITENGNSAYADQWTNFHARAPRCRRSKLVAISATSKSSDSVPNPTHRGRYPARK